MRQYTQTIIEDLCDKGYIPIACVDMQASIYVLHISYEAPDDDPFYELDKFIVKLTQIGASCSLHILVEAFDRPLYLSILFRRGILTIAQETATRREVIKSSSQSVTM
jgi:hypothetical protein